MNHVRKTISLAALALVCALGIPAYAASVALPSVGVSAGAGASAGSGSASAGSDTSVKGTVLSPGAFFNGNPHAVISNVRVSPPQNLSASGKANVSQAPSASAATLTLSRPATSASTSASVQSSNGVLTKDDLQAYVSAMMSHQKGLRSAAFTDSSVRITYAEPGTLLGFIPVTMTATASTDTKGDVHITYPWYKFMVKARNSSDVETNVAAYTKLMLSHTASTTDSTNFTVRAQARLFDQLRLALEGAGETDTYATTGQ